MECLDLSRSAGSQETYAAAPSPRTQRDVRRCVLAGRVFQTPTTLQEQLVKYYYIKLSSKSRTTSRRNMNMSVSGETPS